MARESRADAMSSPSSDAWSSDEYKPPPGSPCSSTLSSNVSVFSDTSCAEVSDEEELEPTSTKAQKNKRTKRIDACAEVSDEEELEPTSTKAQKNKRTKRTDGTVEQTKALIKFRADNEEQFTKKKYTTKQLWE
uniref:Uncharacterized protein n=1 Tax=Knipowitschia caucasica TaxID=637954 RepID=A0AAV2MQV3_KNICA